MAFSDYKSVRLEKGLSLEARPRATTYAAVARFNGKVERWNTDTTDFDRACRVARSRFARLKADHIPGSTEHVTMHAAAKTFIADIRNLPKRKYHQEKWNAISDFFRTVDVAAVDTPLLKQFMRSRNRVSASTLKKDFVTIRLILRHSVEEGWLSALPLFPRVQSSGTNPRPWFQADQWKHLLDVARERLEEAHELPGRHRHQKQDLLDFIQLQVATCMRVDELRSVRVRDVSIRQRNPTAQLLFDTKGHYLGLAPNEYLEIELSPPDDGYVSEARLKRGVRSIVTRTALSGVDTFRERVQRNGLKRDSLLFPFHVKDAFRELLIAAELRMAGGVKRNLKSVRCTGLMLWVLAEPNVSLKLLADNAGTSVSMLDSYYLKPLNVKMNRNLLVS